MRLRMNGHKSDLRKCLRGNLEESDSSHLYEHLKMHDITHFHVQIVEKINSDQLKIKYNDIRKLDDILNQKEKDWIWKLETCTPKGLNTNDGFHIQTKKARKHRTK